MHTHPPHVQIKKRSKSSLTENRNLLSSVNQSVCFQSLTAQHCPAVITLFFANLSQPDCKCGLKHVRSKYQACYLIPLKSEFAVTLKNVLLENNKNRILSFVLDSWKVESQLTASSFEIPSMLFNIAQVRICSHVGNIYFKIGFCHFNLMTPKKLEVLQVRSKYQECYLIPLKSEFAVTLEKHFIQKTRFLSPDSNQMICLLCITHTHSSVAFFGDGQSKENHLEHVQMSLPIQTQCKCSIIHICNRTERISDSSIMHKQIT